MKDRKFYLILAAVALVIVAADLTYFGQLDVAEAEPVPAEQTTAEQVSAEQAQPSEAPTSPAPSASETADQAQPSEAPTSPVPSASETADQAQPIVAAPSECNYDASMMVVDDYQRLYSIADPYLGDLDAKVKVIEFFDPNCGHCRSMHPVMKALVDRHSDIATFYIIPFVLWPYSLPQAEALYVAAGEGKYFEMLEAQYARQKAGGLSVQEISAIADEIGMNGSQVGAAVERAQNRKAILERRQSIVDLGVRGTPTVMINGRFVETASKTPNCLSQMIVEAHEALSESGD